VAHIWHWGLKRSFTLEVMLVFQPEPEDAGFRVRLISYWLVLAVACCKRDSFLPYLQSMAEYGTG